MATPGSVAGLGVLLVQCTHFIVAVVWEENEVRLVVEYPLLVPYLVYTRYRTLDDKTRRGTFFPSFFLLVEIYCVITTALWSLDGSAVVSVHPPAASMGSSVRFL